MLKELIILGAVISPYITSPNYANDIISRDIMNSTSYDLHFAGEMNIHAHSEIQDINGSSSFWTNSYLQVYADEKPNDIYYWINEVDNEQEVLCVFNEEEEGVYEFSLPDLSRDTIQGIQFFQYKTLVGEVYYISQPSIANSTLNSGNILPTGSTASLERYNTSVVNISSLSLNRTGVDRGMIGYVELSIDNAVVIASNSRTGHATFQLEELSNLVAYYGSYTNKLTFTHGVYPRVYNTEGYSKQLAYLSDEYVSYVSFASSNNVGETLAPLETGFKIMGKVFEAMNSFLSYTLLPGITIGVVIAIPLIVLLILFIIKLIKKG